MDFAKKKKKHKGIYGLDTLWQAGIAVVIFGVVLVIGVRIIGGFNTGYATDAAVNNTNVQSVLTNTFAGLTNLSSWTSLITTVVAGIVILALIMGVAYMGYGRSGGSQ